MINHQNISMPTTPVFLDRCVVLVPVWQAEPVLVALVDGILAAGFGAVVVVNDGSDAAHGGVFKSLLLRPGVVVLAHAVNLGKGRALKTGFNHVLTAMPGMDAVVTADADGQHRVDDLVAVAQRLLSAPDAVVLGTRRFGKGVPLRNRFGNRITRAVFRFITGAHVADTQTGLRGFPRALLPQLLVLEGERYEYETAVLAHVCRRAVPVEVPIATVYIEGNRSSHFRPVRDSVRIYRLLARVRLSGVAARS
jgi:glycosyltransferase involved in cell wall biosynthesis